MFLPLGTCPLGKRRNHVFIPYVLDVILMHILDVVFMHILIVLIRMHMLDVVLLLLLATTVIEPLFWLKILAQASQPSRKASQ